MLIETRLQEIVALVDQKKSVTVQELMERFQASESTVRRDLNTLNTKGKLIKVHGGAIARERFYNLQEPDVNTKKELYVEEKIKIGKYAASLIEPYDFIFLDAGTTTGWMIDYITEKNVVFVTNAISHAKNLARNGFTVYVLGGAFKSITEAVVGDEALEGLSKYNFTKGFFGSNGISVERGFTTPDIMEAAVKRKAMQKCQKAFVLSDHSKFGMISSVEFAEFDRPMIITDRNIEKSFGKYKNIVEVTEK